jgi:ethylbenzene dioxygenase alpha subunit
MGDKDIVKYMRSREQEISKRLGDVRSKIWGSVASGAIFPNFAFLPGYFTFRTFLPKGPMETELHSWTLVPREASDEIKDKWRLGTMRTFSPSGILEMDDGENWEHATAANSGYVTRQQKLCYSMNPTKGQSVPIELPGEVVKGQLNDNNQRLFFKRYAEFMDADSWADIPLATKTK